MPKFSTKYYHVQQTSETYFRYTELIEHLKHNESNLPHHRLERKSMMLSIDTKSTSQSQSDYRKRKRLRSPGVALYLPDLQNNMYKIPTESIMLNGKREGRYLPCKTEGKKKVKGQQ